MVEQALALLQDETGHPAYAEIEYEKSRMALREDDQAAASMLLDQARTDALASGHLMLVAICAARKFWKFGAFDLETWWPIEANLTAFPNHGWAVRTVVDGRLRIAKRVADPAVAVGSLRSNLEDLGRNPGFDAGSDRNRIAATAAGLYVLSRGEGGEEAWSDFLKRPWSAEFPAPEEIWRSVPHG
jgi:hypothetical protein